MTVLTGHVLCVRLDSLGDVLLTGGAVRAVARSAGKVSMLVAPTQAAAAALLPGVDDVIAFEAPWVRFDPPPLDPAAVRGLVRELRRRRVDAALVFTSFHQSPLPMALLLRMAGVPWVGAISVDYPGSLLDLRHRVPDDLPEAERNLSLATAAGLPADPDHARLAVRRPLPPRPHWLPCEPYLVMHPGAAVASRRPSAGTSRAITRALESEGWPVVVTGGPDEVALTASVAGAPSRPGMGGRSGKGAIDAGGRLGLAELAAVLAGAQVVIAPNTGPAHLAAAVGTPVVALHAPVVDFAQWGPYGVPVVRLGDQSAACRLTRARSCPIPGHPCLDSIRPEEVVTAVRTLTPARPSPDLLRTPERLRS
jgi:ADP-heptose:LPS heptosyltransferase